MNCSLPGSSVHGISQQEYWSGLPFPAPLLGIYTFTIFRKNNKPDNTNKCKQKEQILRAEILIHGVPLVDFTNEGKSFDLLSFLFFGLSGNYIFYMHCRLAVEFNRENLCRTPGTVPASCGQDVTAPD